MWWLLPYRARSSLRQLAFFPGRRSRSQNSKRLRNYNNNNNNKNKSGLFSLFWSLSLWKRCYYHVYSRGEEILCGYIDKRKTNSGGRRWQVRHYQRCFHTFLLLYGLVLCALVVRFAANFNTDNIWSPPPSATQLENRYDDSAVVLPPGGDLRFENIDSLEMTRQTLRAEDIRWESAPFFPRALNRTDHDRYVELLRSLAELLTRYNVTFIMCDGTLLGSYLVHNMLPWDDDMDIMVKYTDINKIKAIFSNASIWRRFEILGYHDDVNEYDYSILTEGNYAMKDPDPAVYEDKTNTGQALTENNDNNDGTNKKTDTVAERSKSDMLYNYRPYADYTESFQFHDTTPNATQQRYHKFKFFYKNAANAGTRAWKWPFIDVKYYLENRTHVWTLDRRTKTVPRDVFYPLHFRPFAGLWLPAPHDTRGFLRNKYGRFRCRSARWSHREERKQRPRKVRCWRLHSYYPFVWRDHSPAGVIESLMQDSRVIHSVIVKESFFAWQRQFEL